MLATALVEMVPESLELRGRSAAFLVLARLSDHSFLRAHGHPALSFRRRDSPRRVHPFPQRILSPARPHHSHVFRRHRHRLGISGFQLAGLADFSRDLPAQDSRRLHREFRDAGQRTQPRHGMGRISGSGRFDSRGGADHGTVPSSRGRGLPLSAGVTIYVAASDLIPEVNKEPAMKMALLVFVGCRVYSSCSTICSTCSRTEKKPRPKPGLVSTELPLVHRDAHRLRWNSVRHNFQRAGAGFHRLRHVEVR